MEFWTETHHLASYLLLNSENERDGRKDVYIDLSLSCAESACGCLLADTTGSCSDLSLLMSGHWSDFLEESERETDAFAYRFSCHRVVPLSVGCCRRPRKSVAQYRNVAWFGSQYPGCLCSWSRRLSRLLPESGNFADDGDASRSCSLRGRSAWASSPSDEPRYSRSRSINW